MLIMKQQQNVGVSAFENLKRCNVQPVWYVPVSRFVGDMSRIQGVVKVH